jgi:hypothetical protein
MITASELAGFFAAHAMWCVSDGGGPLIPMLAYTTANGERTLHRLAIDDLGAAVAYGKERLAANEVDADDAVLLYDARIPVGKKKLDAIIVEMRTYFSPDSEAVLALPYTPKASGRFRVHKPKLLAWDNCDDFDMSAAFEAFFRGVNGHEKGSRIWNDCLDESL